MLIPRVSKWHVDLITLETYVQQGKTISKFFMYVPQCEKHNIFGYLGGGGGFNNQTGPILVYIYFCIYIYVHVNKILSIKRYHARHKLPQIYISILCNTLFNIQTLTKSTRFTTEAYTCHSMFFKFSICRL